MNISEEKDASTFPSAFDRYPHERQPTGSHYEPQQKWLYLWVRRPIQCSCQKNIKFICKLLKCLSTYQYFLGNAALEQFQPKETRSFRICYSYQEYLEKCSEGEKVSKLQGFQQMCQRIHGKIEEMNSKYRIENRVGYWLCVLEKEVGGVGVSVGVGVDRGIKLFDSN